MTGKSPDKSEQGKSSGETTSEKRTAPEKNQPSTDPAPVDPRTQLLRHTPDEGKSSESTSSEIDAHDETARTRSDSTESTASEKDALDTDSTTNSVDLDTAPPSEGDTAEGDTAEGDTADADATKDAHEADSPEETDEADKADSGDNNEEDGDARLRAVVAAWVAGPQNGEASASSTPSGPLGDDDIDATDDRRKGEDEDEEAGSTKGETAGEGDRTTVTDVPDSTGATAVNDKPDEASKTEEEAGAETATYKADEDKADEDKEAPVKGSQSAEPAILPQQPDDSDSDSAKRQDDDAGKGSGGAAPASLAKAASAAPKSDPKNTSEAETAPKVEESSARRSTFVPLRSDDAPPAAALPRPSASPEAPAGPPASELPAERTRQQPLPPVPGQRPLDLLAELTNKPAPPETPVRTLVRRVKIWTPLLALLALLVIGAQLLRPLPSPELELTAQPTHTFDGGDPAIEWPDAGQSALEVEGLGSLGTSGEQKPVPIASVAKTMTAYVMLRDHPMKAGSDGAKITVDKQAEEDAGLSEQGESTVDVTEGETLTQREALNALMIASANNVARLVARWDAGSEKGFVSKMNEAAEDLGMKNTTYTDPSGLRKETVSTAEDQVKLGKAVMKYEAFRDSVKLPSYEDRNGKKQDNWNRLVPLYGTIGIKTGTTTAAGGNLLFAAEKEIGGTKQLIIGAVLGQHRPPIIDSVLAAGRELIQSTQDALESETIIKKGTTVGSLDNQLGDSAELVTTEDVTAVGWAGLKVKLDLAEGKQGLPEAADAGTKVGMLTVGNGPGQVKVPVALKEELPEASAASRVLRLT